MGLAGWTPLLLAALQGQLACVELLLEREADPSLVNEHTGTTPLMVAAEGGHTEVLAATLAYA